MTSTTTYRQGIIAAAFIWNRDRGSSSDQQFSRQVVSQEFSDQIRTRVLKRGGTMDRDLDCVEDGDSNHYRCLAHFSLQGQRYTLTVAITCDPAADRCISEPSTVNPG